MVSWVHVGRTAFLTREFVDEPVLEGHDGDVHEDDIVVVLKMDDGSLHSSAASLPAAVAAKALATVLLIQSSVSMICFEIC